MQEEVENRTLTLIITGTKLTGRVLKDAVSKYLAYEKLKKQDKSVSSSVTHKGKQSLKELMAQNEGLQKADIDASELKDFERVARKYNIDYAIRKVSTEDNTKYFVFFKARDAELFNAGLEEFAKEVTKDKPSLVEKMREKLPIPKIKNKELER